MRRPCLILQLLPSGFPNTVNEENFVFFFISVQFTCLIEENFENTNAMKSLFGNVQLQGSNRLKEVC